MRTPILLLLLLWSLPAHAQTTYPEVYRAVSVDAYDALGQAVMGPNFARGRAFTPSRTFRLSLSTKKDVDGMVKTVTEKITAPASSSPAELEKAWRAQLPALVSKLAAKIAPFSAVGSFLDTAAKNTDAISQTPDRLIFENYHPFTVRTRYTRGRFTGDHNLYVDVLVGH